jgi:hypothetical protein
MQKPVELHSGAKVSTIPVLCVNKGDVTGQQGGDVLAAGRQHHVMIDV